MCFDLLRADTNGTAYFFHSFLLLLLLLLGWGWGVGGQWGAVGGVGGGGRKHYDRFKSTEKEFPLFALLFGGAQRKSLFIVC